MLRKQRNHSWFDQLGVWDWNETKALHSLVAVMQSPTSPCLACPQVLLVEVNGETI